MSIRLRLTTFGLVVVALALIAFTLSLFGLLRAAGGNDQDRRLAARAHQAVQALSVTPSDAVTAGTSPAPLDAAESDEMFLIVLRADGTPLSSTGVAGGIVPSIPADVLAAAGARGLATTIDSGTGQHLRVYLLPWDRPDLGMSGYVVAAQSTHRAASELKGARVFVVVAAVIAFIIAAIAIWLVSGRALRPLRQLAALTDDVGRTQDLDRRLPVPSANDEVRRLGESFNGMMARLADARSQLTVALDSQRRFVADASHELRTPLTSIRSNAGFLLQHPEAQQDDRTAALHDIAAESERMSRLVHGLLTLARADGGFQLERTTIDLRSLVGDVSAQAARLRTDREILTDLQASTVYGNDDAFRQLVWILIDNAVRHTRRGGQIRIALASDGGSARMVVEDDGDGFPEGDEERIFERFYQADRARAHGGSGLGLSIARWIAEQHGGGISARNRREGGAVFDVELPARATAGPAPETRTDSGPGANDLPRPGTAETTLPTSGSFSSNP